MISFVRASLDDASELAKVQTITFDDDSRITFGRSSGGPPGYNSTEAQENFISEHIYYKILFRGKIIGGIMVTAINYMHYELTRIFILPEYQNMGIGQKSMEFIEKQYPFVKKWTLDTPAFSLRNRYIYEKTGYKKVGELLLDPKTGLKLFFYEKNL